MELVLTEDAAGLRCPPLAHNNAPRIHARARSWTVPRSSAEPALRLLQNRKLVPRNCHREALPRWSEPIRICHCAPSRSSLWAIVSLADKIPNRSVNLPQKCGVIGQVPAQYNYSSGSIRFSDYRDILGI